MHDAILLSGWRWATFNTPERIAAALSAAGAKVLYCENPSSFLKNASTPAEALSTEIFVYKPLILGQRLNNFSFSAQLQCRSIAKQITIQSKKLGLQEPVFFYPHLKSLTPLLHQMKSRGFRLVHLCIDAPESYQWEQIELSDLTLTIPPSIHEVLEQRYPGKSYLIPQPYYAAPSADSWGEPAYLTAIPRPRFAYVGPAFQRLDVPLIEAVFRTHPEWHFLTFGGSRISNLPNTHCIPWCDWKDIPRIAQHIDAGFMPYNRSLEFNFHCVPLKLFDYFAAGLPVVSTSIPYVQRYPELIFLADTAEQISNSLAAALSEPADSQLKQKRRELISSHSIASVAERLKSILLSGFVERGSQSRLVPDKNSKGAPR